jgi:hypothetical protein
MYLNHVEGVAPIIREISAWQAIAAVFLCVVEQRIERRQANNEIIFDK